MLLCRSAKSSQRTQTLGKHVRGSWALLGIFGSFPGLPLVTCGICCVVCDKDAACAAGSFPALDLCGFSVCLLASLCADQNQLHSQGSRWTYSADDIEQWKAERRKYMLFCGCPVCVCARACVCVFVCVA
jgi:hypothetical protein